MGVCAKWRLDVLGTILVFTHHTDRLCQNRSWKESYICVGSCRVSVISSSRTITQKEHLNMHKVVAELAIEDLVANEVFLKNYCLPMSDYEEDSIDVESFSNFSSAESLGGAYCAEATDQWTASRGITVNFPHSLTGQLRGSSMRLVVQVKNNLKYQKELTVELEMCWNTVWQLAGGRRYLKQKEDPVLEKKPQKKKVRGYHNQFAEAKHLECESWIDNEVFDLVDQEKVKPRNYVPEDVYLPSRRTNRVTSSRQRQDGCWEISKTNRININRMILLLQQDLDFGWVATWQPARVGTLFTLILRQLSFNESESVNRDVVCHFLPQAGHPPSLDQGLCSYGMIPMRADRCCYVLYSTPTCKPNWSQRCSRQVNSTIDISLKSRARSKRGAAFDRMLHPIGGSPATDKSVAGIINLFVDDLFGTSGTEMEQRVLAWRKKDFQVGSEDWNDVRYRIRCMKDPQLGPSIEVSQERLKNWRSSESKRTS